MKEITKMIPVRIVTTENGEGCSDDCQYNDGDTHEDDYGCTLYDILLTMRLEREPGVTYPGVWIIERCSRCIGDFGYPGEGQ